MAEGWEGWDEYAPFYDWENARTLGRRDVPFWERLAGHRLADRPATQRRILELGCGTGRVTFPLARAGVAMVGIDRSDEMLARAARRRRRGRRPLDVHLVRGDIRHLPFADGSFPLVIAPYGILQSLLRERDLAATLDAVSRVIETGGTFGLELVADLPGWSEYSNKISLRGKRAGGAHVTLIESVRQDRKRKLTLFDQKFVETTPSPRSGQRPSARTARGLSARSARSLQARVTRSRTFTLTFRTLSVRQMVRRLERAGFTVSALLGDYQGGPWDERAEVWIILAAKAKL